MRNNWIKDELLTERKLEEYENDNTSHLEFDRNFENRNWYDRYVAWAAVIPILLIILFLFIAFIVNLFDIENDINRGVLIIMMALIMTGGFVSVLAGSIESRKKRRTPAICSKCKSIMCRYKYTDEVGKHNLNGIVYLCRNCNTKFIDERPSEATCSAC